MTRFWIVGVRYAGAGAGLEPGCGGHANENEYIAGTQHARCATHCEISMRLLRTIISKTPKGTGYRRGQNDR